MVSNMQNKNTKSTAEMVQADPPESKTSSLKPTIEYIHDRSENEEDTPNKTSMKNVLYEPGKCKFYAACVMYIRYICIYIT